MEDYQPSPAAQMIERRRLAIHLAVRRAAEAADLSEGRWRQIAKGYQQATKGVRVPVNAPPETLARMARAVGLTDADLRDAGVNDVAELLAASATREHGVGVVLDMGRYERALESLSDWMADDTDPEREIHPPTGGLWLWTPGQLSDALGEQTSALERAFADSIHEHMSALARGRRPFNDQPEESENRGGDPAPTNHAGASPAQDVTVEDGEVVDDPEAEPGPRPATGRPRRHRDG